MCHALQKYKFEFSLNYSLQFTFSFVAITSNLTHLVIVSVLVEHARDELDLLAGEPETRLLPLDLEVVGRFFLEDPDHF